MTQKIALTIDCEEWNSPALRGKRDAHHNSTLFSKVGNQALLNLFAKHGVKATFFVTGFYAQNEPDDLTLITQAGHEVAAHGYEHHYRNRGEEFDLAADVLKAKKVIEGVIGKGIGGFRAPQVQYSRKLLEALAAAGYTYDSSLHPAYLPGYYNHRKFPLRPHKPLSHLNITQVPVAVMPKTRLPVVWMFMRLFGWRWSQHAVEKLLRRGIAANLYVHSWEFTKMRSKNMPFYFTARTGKKFLRTLEKFIIHNKKKGREFVTLSEVVE